MSSVDDLLQQLDPVSPDELARLEGRIKAEATEQRGVALLLQSLTPPSEVETLRLDARLRASREARSSGRRRSLRGLAPATALLAAAAVALNVQWTAPPAPPPSGAQVLAGVSHLQPLKTVALDYGGQGDASWEGKVVRIDWEEGTLTSSVTPQQGIDLSVHTREAVVSVVGTEFSVTRDVDGSHVSVAHGVVSVACESSGAVTLRSGQQHTCPPVSPGQWLFKIDQLFAESADSDRIRASIQRGIHYSAVGEPLRGELLARQVQLLLRDGAPLEAARAAQQYLDEGYTVRAVQLRIIADQTSP